VTPLRVEAEIVGDTAGLTLPLHLDGLLIAMAAQRQNLSPLCRSRPAPEFGSVPIPVAVGDAGGVPVYRCSEAIFEAEHDTVRHVCRRFPSESATELAPEERTRITTSGGPYKSWRVPIRTRTISRVVWFLVGDAAGVRGLLADCDCVGRLRNRGLGRVRKWSVAEYEKDLSWFAESPAGPCLMRVLPAGEWLPENLWGLRLDFGAYQPPYWHPDNFRSIVSPA